MNRLRSIVCALACLASAVPAAAHEIGLTSATVTIRSDGTYQVDVIVDPDGLLTKLQVYSGGAMAAPASPQERDQQIVALASVFLGRVKIEFDGATASSALQYIASPSRDQAAPLLAIVRLTGRVPVGARVVRISNGLALGAYAVTVQTDSGPPLTIWASGATPSPAIRLERVSLWRARTAFAGRHFAAGYTQILPSGFEHILFALGIFLMNTRWRQMLTQLAAFTLANAITLVLTLSGVVSVSTHVIDPLIALSLAYVAVENLLAREVEPWGVGLVCLFGLLHGLGFGGALNDPALPRLDSVTSQVSFALGTESGQILVVLLAFAVVAVSRTHPLAYRRVIVQPASLIIAAMGGYWTIARALGL